MTEQDALTAASGLLGPTAYAEQVAVRSELAFQVGIIEQGCRRVRGTGPDWEAALKVAVDLEPLVIRGNP